MAIGKDRRVELRALTVGPDSSVRDVLNLMNLKDEMLDELDRLDAEIGELRKLCRTIREDAGLNDVIAAIGDEPGWWPELLRQSA